MAGEHKRERSDIETGVDKGSLPITGAGDDLVFECEVEKMNEVGGTDDRVNIQKTKPSEEVVKVSDNDQVPKKKPRLIWTHELRNSFRDAVKHLGFNRAVPTKILELMNVEHLTRENVASHLQKFRLQMKRREEEQAQEHAASGNVPKAVYPTMSGIPQQPRVQPNTMQGINMECTCLDRSQIAPSFENHNLNMIQGFPSIQEVYGTPFKDVGVNRMSSVGRVHGLYDSNDPYDINKFVRNYDRLRPRSLVDSYAHKLMARSYFHDTPFVPLHDWRRETSLADQGFISPSSVPQYDRRGELSPADLGIISPSSVRQYDRRDELSLADLGVIGPSSVRQYDRRDELSLADLGVIGSSSVRQYDRRDELSLADLGVIGSSSVHQYDRRDELSLADLGIISPSFVSQYDRRDELSVADQGIISPSLAQEGLGVGMPHLPEATGGLTGIGLGGLGVHMPRLPETAGGVLAGMKVEGIGGLGVDVTHPPEATGGLIGMKVEGLGGLGVGVPHLPEATKGLAGMKVEGLGGVGVGVPRPPEAIGGLVRMKVEGFGVDVSHPPNGGLAGMKVEGVGVGVPRPPNGGLGRLGGVGVGVPRPPEAIGGLTGMKVEGLGRLGGVGVGVPRPPEAIGGRLTGMKVEVEGQGMPPPPEATGGLMKVEGFGVDVPRPPEATGDLAGMNDFPLGLDQTFNFDGGIDSDLDLSGFWMNMEGDVDGKSIDDLFR